MTAIEISVYDEFFKLARFTPTEKKLFIMFFPQGKISSEKKHNLFYKNGENPLNRFSVHISGIRKKLPYFVKIKSLYTKETEITNFKELNLYIKTFFTPSIEVKKTAFAVWDKNLNSFVGDKTCSMLLFSDINQALAFQEQHNFPVPTTTIKEISYEILEPVK